MCGDAHGTRMSCMTPTRQLSRPLIGQLTAAVLLAYGAATAAGAAGNLEQARGRLAELQDQLTKAVQAEDAAYRERDSFLAAHFQLLQSSTRVPPPAARETAAPVNPKWQELDNKVRELEQRRAEMLERLTPAHPALIS